MHISKFINPDTLDNGEKHSFENPTKVISIAAR